MKKTFKTIVALMLALAMVISMVACAGNNSKPAESSATESKAEESKAEESKAEESKAEESVAEESQEEESAPATEGAKDLYIWDMMWGTADNMQAADQWIVDSYKEVDPNVNITIELKEWNSYMETYSTAIASGTQPDSWTGGGCQIGLYHAAGELLDLTPIVDEWTAEGNAILDDFIPAALTAFKYEDELAAILMGIDCKVLMYRKDFLAEAGITTDYHGDYTIEQWTEDMRALKEFYPDKTILIAPSNGTIATHNFCITCGFNGVGFTDENLVPCVSSEKGMAALQWAQDLWKEGIIGEGDAAYQENDAQKIFAADGAVFGYGFNNSSFRDCEFYPELSIMAPPTGGFTVNCPNPIAVFKNAKNASADPSTVLAYTKWWMENNLDYFKISGCSNYPTRASYYEDEYYASEQLRLDIYQYNVAIGHAETYPVEQFYPAFLQIDGELPLSKCFQRVIMGEDVATVAAETDALIQEALDTYGA